LQEIKSEDEDVQDFFVDVDESMQNSHERDSGWNVEFMKPVHLFLGFSYFTNRIEFNEQTSQMFSHDSTIFDERIRNKYIPFI
jgi:hypothetical protein